MSVTSFRDLEVWRLSMELARRVYVVTMCLPWPHRGELGSQMRRASVSIPSNLAEGFRQGAPRAYLRHVRIAAGSAAELETQIELACTLRLLTAEDATALRAMSARAGKMLTGLVAALHARSTGA